MEHSVDNHDITIIGCGGIGSWLGRLLSKQVLGSSLTLMDGDTVEDRNLDRQLFSMADIGKMKCDCLKDKLDKRVHVECIPEYFIGSNLDDNPLSFMFVAADNHPARLQALRYADRNQSKVIIAANEYTDAEAYFYDYQWKDTPRDPRIYYPEISSDHTGDPAMPCTGAEQEAAPQLAISNSLAASYAAWLYWFWTVKQPEMSGEFQHKFPHIVRGNFAKITSVSESDQVGE